MPDPAPARIPPQGTPGPAQTSDASVETRLAEMQEQFIRLKAQIRQAQQLASLGTAAAIFAHEVNNLLTPILAYSTSALEGDDQDLREKALQVTQENVRMLVSMSDRLLGITAAKPADRESVALADVARAAAASLCRDLGKDGIAFRVDVDEALTVRADRLQLQQILFNLFLNARQVMATEGKGKLTVCARSTDGNVALEVHNTGTPISTDLLPHLFEPFATSKESGDGGRHRCAGLGLALCRDLVEENGGTIAVASEAGEGTRFTITLPVGDAQPP